MPIAVSAPPWQATRGVATVSAELERQDGLPGLLPKHRHATFIIAAPPFSRLAIYPRELHVSDEGWSQRDLSITNNASYGQYFDVAVATVSDHFRVETTSSRIFIEGEKTVDYPVLVWCDDKDATGEMDITFTPDHGGEETIRVALNKGEWDLDQLLEGKDGAPPPVGTGLLLALAAFMLLALASPKAWRRPLMGPCLVFLLVFSQFLVILPGETSALTIGPDPSSLTLSRDQLFYQFQLTVTNDDLNEKTYQLFITGSPFLFAYSHEWVIPAQESVTVPVVFMKDYYQEQDSILILITADEVENEGLAIQPVPGQTGASISVVCPGDDLFHGTLNPEKHVRDKEGAGEIRVDVTVSRFTPELSLFTQDRESGNWNHVKDLQSKEGSGGMTPFSCQLEKNEVKPDQLYAIRLFLSENDTEPIQTINVVFKEDEDDSGMLPGFELGVLFLVVVCVTVVRGSGRNPEKPE